MKVIFLKDVAKQGQKYDVKNVSDGHAMNFLFPRGLAQMATDKNMKKVDDLKSAHQAELKIREDLLIKNLNNLVDTRITLQEKTNEKGHLFAGIHKAEIIAAVKNQTGLDIDASHISLEHPIKGVGEYDIPIKIQDKEAKFKLSITSL